MFCVASEVLTKDRTMTILVKQVIKIRIPGATEKTVKSSSNLTVELTSVGLFELKRLMNSFMVIRAFLLSFRTALFQLVQLFFQRF
ncbi:hypothetical protein M5C89_03430 [Bacillus velezensis]|nr:hypothetical protein M5C89_03430 [Bacillus velezensis]